MNCTRVTAFIFENGVRVEFFPVSNVPGFTHKVFVLDTCGGKAFKTIGKDWFTPVAGRISEKTAQFYYDKHMGVGKA